MIKEMKTLRDNKELCTAILTDLFKAFDCICYDLLIAKLEFIEIEAWLLLTFFLFLHN